mgnify:CR=1 FL=1
MEQREQPPRAKRLKIAIIILAVLLVLSAGGLAARVYLSGVFRTHAIHRRCTGQPDRQRQQPAGQQYIPGQQLGSL